MVVTKEQVRFALSGYRERSDNLIKILIPELPEGIEKIATVCTNFAFVNAVTRVERAGIGSGQINELFFNCPEFFEYAGGRKPKDKEVYQFSIDFILKRGTSRLLMVSCDEDSFNYLRETSSDVQEIAGFTFFTPKKEFGTDRRRYPVYKSEDIERKVQVYQV